MGKKGIPSFFVHHITIIVTIILIILSVAVLELPFIKNVIGKEIEEWIKLAVYGFLALGLTEMIILCKNTHDIITTINERSKNNSELIPKINNKLHSGDTQIEKDNVLFEKNKNLADDRVKQLLDDGEVSAMRIICYGTGYMGDTILNVLHYNGDDSHTEKVKLEVVICSSHPQNVSFDKDTPDEKGLDLVRQRLEEAENIKVFISKIIPTVRACIVKGNDGRPIYCYYQPYYFYPQCFKYEDTLPYQTLLHAQGSPMIIAEDGEEILEHLVKSCNYEFERLRKYVEKGAKKGIIVNNIKGITNRFSNFFGNKKKKKS